MRTVVFQFMGPRHYEAGPGLTLCRLTESPERGQLTPDGEITSWALPLCEKCVRLEADGRAEAAA